MSSLADLGTAFGVTFISELGDKSQLMLIALAARWPRHAVAIGGIIGIVAVQVIAVVVGGTIASSGISEHLPMVVGGAFLAIGVAMLANLWRRHSDTDAADFETASRPPPHARSALWSAMGLAFAAELGDKTMFTTAALASVRSPWAVLIGSAAAFTLLVAMATALGAAFADKINERTTELIGALTFCALGLALAAS